VVFRNRRDVFVTENLDMRVRPRFPQRLERRQSQDEIADRAAADHQNAIHPLISHKRKGENYATVNKRDGMKTPPAKNTPGAPVDLIAKHVRDRDPE
jgi:hypothetical protein